MGMIKNYFKVALRTLLKNRLTTSLNILGLVVGLGSALTIELFVMDEFSYDRHFNNFEQICRVVSTSHLNGTISRSALSEGNLSRMLVDNFPAVKHATRLLKGDEAFLFSNENAVKESIVYTDSAFLNVFDFELVVGNAKECLAHPSSLLLSEATAEKIFGMDWRQREIQGKTLLLDGKMAMIVTGVFKNLPPQTHFRMTLLATPPWGHENWLGSDSRVYTYVLLNALSDRQSLMNGINENLPPTHLESGVRYELQPLDAIHFSSDISDENALKRDFNGMVILVLVATVLLLVTTTNFASLLMARTIARSKEVGVRKAIGAVSGQIRGQFFTETLLVTFTSAVLSLAVVSMSLPAFNDLTEKTITLADLFHWSSLILLLILVVVISTAASLLPLFQLSKLRAYEALKGLAKTHALSRWRKGLVALQFVISGVAVVVSLAAINQLKYIDGMEVGFNKKNTIAIANPYLLGSTDEIKAFRDRLLTIDGIEAVSISGYTPSQTRWGTTFNTTAGDGRDVVDESVTWLTVDEGFLNTMGVTLLQGRTFSATQTDESGSVIINEEAVHNFGLNKHGKSPIGAQLQLKGDDGLPKRFTVIGVVRDFNFSSLHDRIKPTAMKYGYHRFEIAVRYASTASPSTIVSDMERVWKESIPLVPFEYNHIKNRFDALHKSDLVVSKIFGISCLFTIVLSALGLFSISSYTIASRTKEIGIRRVLGASSVNIATTVSAEFIRLIFMSLILSLPLSFILSNQWLSNFAYHIDVTWHVYACMAGGLSLVASVPLVYHSVRASAINPVKHMRSE
jgi:putative ABC transport system permease protein